MLRAAEGLGLRTLGEIERGAWRAPVLPSGIAGLDEALGGGLPHGGILEVVSPGPGRGSQSLLTGLIALARKERAYAALIEAGNHFDPEYFRGADIWMEHLLWVRCGDTAQSLRAADILCRDDHFRFVLIDLTERPEQELKRTRSALWYRLQRAREEQSGSMVFFTPARVVMGARTCLKVDGHARLEDLEAPGVEFSKRLGISLLRGGSDHCREAV